MIARMVQFGLLANEMSVLYHARCKKATWNAGIRRRQARMISKHTVSFPILRYDLGDNTKTKEEQHTSRATWSMESLTSSKQWKNKRCFCQARHGNTSDSSQ